MRKVILERTFLRRDCDGGIIPSARYIWRGPASDPVFSIQDSREIRCVNIDVVCENQCAAVFRVERTKSGPGVTPSTMHQWRNVRIYGDGHALVAFDYRGIDENNEHGRWESCSVYGCITGWSFRGVQSKEHLLTHCRFESGITALSTDTGFQWLGGCVAACETGIFLARYGDPVLIQGVGFEAVKRLLLTVNNATDAQPITLVSCRYAADQLHEDGAMIVLRHAGPLTIIGGSFGDGAQRVPQIHLAGIGEQAVSIIGAKFGSYGADATAVIRANNGVRPTIHTGALAFQRAAESSERTTIRAGV